MENISEIDIDNLIKTQIEDKISDDNGNIEDGYKYIAFVQRGAIHFYDNDEENRKSIITPDKKYSNLYFGKTKEHILDQIREKRGYHKIVNVIHGDFSGYYNIEHINPNITITKENKNMIADAIESVSDNYITFNNLQDFPDVAQEIEPFRLNKCNQYYSNDRYLSFCYRSVIEKYERRYTKTQKEKKETTLEVKVISNLVKACINDYAKSKLKIGNIKFEIYVRFNIRADSSLKKGARIKKIEMDTINKGIEYIKILPSSFIKQNDNYKRINKIIDDFIKINKDKKKCNDLKFAIEVKKNIKV